MALKDWKKEREGYFVRKNNSSKMVSIFKNKIQSELKNREIWYVDISDYFFYNVQSFKTKSEALAYAKGYMKKH